MPRLIVNADDFGLTSGVNRAILELHQAGVLTSATLMARAAATEEAIEIAKATPSLGVGCHVVLVDGEPVLSGIHDIPNVADPVYGRFEPTLGSFLNAHLQGKHTAKVDYQIEIEARAQIQSLQSRGIRLTHIDTHKHTHMFPRVLRPGPPRRPLLRNPRRPQSLRARLERRATPGAPFVRRRRSASSACSNRASAASSPKKASSPRAAPSASSPPAPSTPHTITSLLRALPDQGTYELVTHPGYNDADLAQANTRLLASREIERQSLARPPRIRPHSRPDLIRQPLNLRPATFCILFAVPVRHITSAHWQGDLMRIGITCYPTYGGSGVVATELGIELAALGHEVHFISYSQPFRLNGRDDGIFYHEVPVSNYPLFEFPPYDLALASRMAEVAEFYELDLLHVHYAIPHSVSALLARQMLAAAAASCLLSPPCTAPTSPSSASTAATCPSPAMPSRRATASPASPST